MPLTHAMPLDLECAEDPSPETVMTADITRHEALLSRMAAQVSAYDGSRPGGALLGPRLLLIAAQERLPDDRLLRLGTAVEMTRRATIVHRDPKREGLWEGFGEVRFSRTLLGDVLLSESFRLLALDGEPRTVQILARAMAGVAAGELERHTADTEDGEEALHLQSAFYEGVAATGALLGGLNPDDTVRYKEWARAAGACHERALAGLTPPVETLARLRRDALTGTVAFSGRLLERLGTPDIVWP